MYKEITKQDLETIYQKFLTDPDWKIIEALIMQFVEPLKSIENIDTKGKTADEVFAQLKGRQDCIEALTSFLNETKLVQGIAKIDPPKFK